MVTGNSGMISQTLLQVHDVRQWSYGVVTDPGPIYLRRLSTRDCCFAWLCPRRPIISFPIGYDLQTWGADALKYGWLELDILKISMFSLRDETRAFISKEYWTVGVQRTTLVQNKGHDTDFMVVDVAISSGGTLYTIVQIEWSARNRIHFYQDFWFDRELLSISAVPQKL